MGTSLNSCWPKNFIKMDILLKQVMFTKLMPLDQFMYKPLKMGLVLINRRLVIVVKSTYDITLSVVSSIHRKRNFRNIYLLKFLLCTLIWFFAVLIFCIKTVSLDLNVFVSKYIATLATTRISKCLSLYSYELVHFFFLQNKSGSGLGCTRFRLWIFL